MEPTRSPADVQDGWAHGISGTVIRENRVVHVEHVWGTAITITITGISGRESDAVAVIDRCCSWFAEVDRIFSPYRDDSQVIAVRAGSSDQLDPLFTEVAAACALLRDETSGAFDPWAAAAGYDPSAYVKGWAAEAAMDLIEAAGFADALVNAGGDVCARGDELPGSRAGWPVGIVNPYESSELIETVSLKDAAIATSGRYERGDHVVDPATGRAALSVDSASVVGPDLGVADALSTAAMVRGLGAATWVAARGPQWSLHLVINGVGYTYGQAFEVHSY